MSTLNLILLVLISGLVMWLGGFSVKTVDNADTRIASVKMFFTLAMFFISMALFAVAIGNI